MVILVNIFLVPTAEFARFIAVYRCDRFSQIFISLKIEFESCYVNVLFRNIFLLKYLQTNSYNMHLQINPFRVQVDPQVREAFLKHQVQLSSKVAEYPSTRVLNTYMVKRVHLQRTVNGCYT